MASPPSNKPGTLTRIDISNISRAFAAPIKRINDGDDVTFFLASKAYTDIVTFVLQLTASLFPRLQPDGSIQAWEINSPAIHYTPTVMNLRALVAELYRLVDDYPPHTGPRRFGNVAFRAWFVEVEERVDELLERYLSGEVIRARGEEGEGTSPKLELRAYLMGSWGSAQRLDYGTGHELSFLAFLGCLWKLGAFNAEAEEGVEERGIVLGIVEPYLDLIRRLIKTYTLEPAGSHGVWGLDDHSFLPYIFGSAQFAPAIANIENIPTEGSLSGAPNPADITKATVVERERKKNMYFAAVGLIFDVKKGPFWEHSPILYDVSGVTKGWAKINKGMIKMYIVEVLSKFPVVQHFPFGSLFEWEPDINAGPAMTSAHLTSQPSTSRPPQKLSSLEGTAAPWPSGPTAQKISAPGAAIGHGPIRAPWPSHSRTILPNRSIHAQPLASQSSTASMMPLTRASWASRPGSASDASANVAPISAAADQLITRAPWAK